MPAYNTMFVVSTQDTAFYNMVNIGILRAGGVGTVTRVDNVAAAESKFAKNKTNVLLLDADRGVFNHALMKKQRETYRLLVIFTGATGSQAAVLAKAGFAEFIPKPKAMDAASTDAYVGAVIKKCGGFPATRVKLNPMDMYKTVDENSKLIAVAASTGGTEALEKILRAMDADIPPMLVVQHMPSGFTKLYADRLNGTCRMEVKEAVNNEYVRAGVVYIAPADFHMALAKSNSRLVVRCFTGTKIHGVMPAADVLFDSVAPIMKGNAVGVILTGMGSDGAKGLHNMRKNGAKTIGQNKETCVVYGMPKVAYDLGAVDEQLPLQSIAPAIMRLCRK